MSGRLAGRVLVVLLALLRRYRRRSFDSLRDYRRILVAHHLLLGDTMLLTPLLAKLRQRYPGAEIWMTVSPPFVSLYEGRPYGVRVLPYHPREVATLLPWLRLGGFDLALVPGDNRYSWLARALGARCILALTSERNDWKSWQVDRPVAWPTTPCSVAELLAGMVEGPEPPAFSPEQWPAGRPNPDLPQGPYCVLHVSARNRLRRWPAHNWHQLGETLRQRGCQIVWSAAPGETALLDTIEPHEADIRFPGTLGLKELRQLIGGAKVLVTVETGIAHLCRITGTPSVVIFGQGNPALHGVEPFWRDSSPMEPVFNADVPCRDQSHVFGRQLPWVRRCDRGSRECASPICIDSLRSDDVEKALERLEEKAGGTRQ